MAIAVTDRKIVYSKPIPVSNFTKYVAELHTDMNQPFQDLFQALDSGENGRSTSYATDPQRCHLNRCQNIVVYDDNLITLKPLPGHQDCNSDYINASYIDGYSVPNKFIAAQGPLPEKEMDFWLLIWQEQVSVIVMLTNDVNRFKCQQYWPDSGKKQYGPFHVIITDQQIFADFIIRTLSVSPGYEHSRKVTQFHYTAWPDRGIPELEMSLLSFYRRVKAQYHPFREPMLIHCSAGVGRTGTYIAIDNSLEQMEKEQVVDIPGTITKIRQKRMKMVQNYKQFAFIHDAIVEYMTSTSGDAEITAVELERTLSKI